MRIILLLLCLSTQLYPASASTTHTTPEIEITEMQPEHVEQAKDVFYHAVHELQFISSTCVADVKTFCTEKNVCKDYNNAAEHYFNNRGTFLVILLNQKVVGTGGIKRVDDEACEVKRVFLAPEIRGTGVSKLLGERLLAAALKLGYKKMYLEMYKPEAQQAAMHIAEKMGFTERTEPYYEGSTCKRFMEKEL